jgi:alkylated DNA repair dioxygenase AlkB
VTVSTKGVPVDQGDLFGVLPVLPQGLEYVLDFIGADEEAALIEAIAQLPPQLALKEAKYKEYTARRRTTTFGSEYDFGANVLEAAPAVPEFLLPLREKVAAWTDIPPARFAQALVTEYRPGTPLGWHRDVPQFEVIAGVSLGAACVMRFRPYEGRAARARGDAFSLELHPRSAYIMRESARWDWQHAIAPTPGLRYSITFRTLRKKPRG